MKNVRFSNAEIKNKARNVSILKFQTISSMQTKKWYF